MAIPYINGIKNQRLIIKNNNNVIIETIDLPLTNENGYSEDKDEEVIIQKFTDGSNIYIFKYLVGYWVTFNLDFSKYITVVDELNIQKIQDYENAKDSYGNPIYKLILIPNSDLLIRSFEVYISGTTLKTEKVMGVGVAYGDKLTGLQFKTKQTVPSGNWIDPNTVPEMTFSLYNRLSVASI